MNKFFVSNEVYEERMAICRACSLSFLKRNKLHHESRWIIKYVDNDKQNLVREVKLVYCPDEYRGVSRPRVLHTQEGLIKILKNDKRRRHPKLLQRQERLYGKGCSEQL
jgi:hypothetical protein